MSSEMRFCPECSNLLYPKEDKEHRQLILLCRSCDFLQYAEPKDAEQNCVDRHNYNFRSKEDVNSYIAQGLGDDATLPREPNWKCSMCPNRGAVFFQLPERVADDAMTLVFVCTRCTFCEVKGKVEEGDDDDDDEDDENDDGEDAGRGGGERHMVADEAIDDDDDDDDRQVPGGGDEFGSRSHHHQRAGDGDKGHHHGQHDDGLTMEDDDIALPVDGGGGGEEEDEVDEGVGGDDDDEVDGRHHEHLRDDEDDDGGGIGGGEMSLSDPLAGQTQQMTREEQEALGHFGGAGSYLFRDDNDDDDGGLGDGRGEEDGDVRLDEDYE